MHSRRLLPWLAPMTLALLRVERSYARKGLHELLRELTPSRWRYAKSWAEAEAIRDASDLLVHHLPRRQKLGNCLAQSLLRYRALRQRGFPVRFHLGMRKDQGELTGHAWLTLHGEPLWEPNFQPPDGLYAGALANDGFSTTFCYPPDDRPGS